MPVRPDFLFVRQFAPNYLPGAALNLQAIFEPR